MDHCGERCRLDTFRLAATYPLFSLVAVLLVMLMMTFFSTAIMLPLTAFKSGVILLPGGIVNGSMAPVAGKLFD
ncbi:hypothetical protein [Paenibacillus sp. FJAT-27812]|uniref:hypothetical protein n=1 Tax=Paenibacillus sp. FJAT-27812 TaxID=1684143 RepID=UPI0006A7A925|nr:hypothetical protein [Paenibacillus sp. FJAT-27812]